jgi:hypothetical protein
MAGLIVCKGVGAGGSGSRRTLLSLFVFLIGTNYYRGAARGAARVISVAGVDPTPSTSLALSNKSNFLDCSSLKSGRQFRLHFIPYLRIASFFNFM